MDDKWERLEARLNDLEDLGQAIKLMHWDQEVMMPEGGGPARARSLATLQGLAHDRLTDPEMGELLGELSNDSSLDEWKRATVRNTKRDYDKATKVPAELVRELAELEATAYQVWTKARPANDFSMLEPHLTRMLVLKKEAADAIGWENERYDALLDDFEPGMTAKEVEVMYDELATDLRPLVDKIIDAAGARPEFIDRTYDSTKQEDLCQWLVKSMLFSNDGGRLDTSPHPFTMSVSRGDVRQTTKADPNAIMMSIYAAAHETGHALYEQNLPDEHKGTPAGQVPSLENFSSTAVLAALGTPLTNKYAEGYPGKRYYGGCEFVDVVENLAIERAKQIFGAEHVNVQPHSGASANVAAYFAFVKPGDKIMGLSLAHGGHLTHGHFANFSGKLFDVVPYSVDKETELIDMDEVRDIALRERPRLVIAGASAYPRSWDFAAFRAICDEIEAVFVVDAAHFIGLVAGGAHDNPVPHADVVTATTHKTLRGPRGAMIMCKEEHAAAIDKSVFPGWQGGPLMHSIAAKAVAFKEAQSDAFKEYSHQTVANAKAMAETLSQEGMRIVSGGTDNHLMLVDLRPLGLTGKVAEERLDEVGITVNKNAIPYDPEKPFIASGIRIGTPAITTCGMKEEQTREVGRLIARTLKDDSESAKKEVRAGVEALTGRFRPYPDVA